MRDEGLVGGHQLGVGEREGGNDSKMMVHDVGLDRRRTCQGVEGLTQLGGHLLTNLLFQLGGVVLVGGVPSVETLLSHSHLWLGPAI